MDALLRVRVVPKTWVPVASLHEASLAVRQHLDAYGLGYSRWGQAYAPVRDAAGKVVAVISFNGRCWTPQRDWKKRTEIATGGGR